MAKASDERIYKAYVTVKRNVVPTYESEDGEGWTIKIREAKERVIEQFNISFAELERIITEQRDVAVAANATRSRKSYKIVSPQKRVHKR